MTTFGDKSENKLMWNIFSNSMNNTNKENKDLFKKFFSFYFLKEALLVGFCFLNSVAYLQENDTLYPQKYYYNSGSISSEGTLENGLPTGKWRNYYESGILKSEGEKIAGKSTGTWIFYSPKGIKEKSISYQENLKNGSYQQFDPVGNLVLESTYRNDTLEGISRTFKHGKIKTETKYSGGLKNGEEKVFDDADGRVIETIYYSDDKPESKTAMNRVNDKKQKTGLWRTFYPDGKMKTECFYAADTLIGTCKQWTEKGILVQDRGSSQYKEVIEVSQTFHPNGQLASFESRLGKLKHGVSSSFDTSGVLLSSYLYNMDTLTAKGFILPSGTYDSSWVYYHPNAQRSAEGKYKNGLKTGTWTYYDSKGKVIQKGPFRKGIIDGTWVWYFSNGQLRREESYLSGKREGASVEYDSLGNKLTEGTYVNDLQHGAWFYHKNEFVEKGTFDMGMKTGLWKYYCMDENLCFKGNFKNGSPVGKHYFYHGNGKLKTFGKYKNGRQNGEWKEYDEKGLLIHTYNYKSGTLVSVDGERYVKHAE